MLVACTLAAVLLTSLLTGQYYASGLKPVDVSLNCIQNFFSPDARSSAVPFSLPAYARKSLGTLANPDSLPLHLLSLGCRIFQSANCQDLHSVPFCGRSVSSKRRLQPACLIEFSVCEPNPTVPYVCLELFDTLRRLIVLFDSPLYVQDSAS